MLLEDLFGPLVGKTKYCIKNFKHPAEELSEVHIDPEDMLCFHYVVSLFTNTPIPQTIEIMWERLKRDKTLKKRTLLEMDNIQPCLSPQSMVGLAWMHP